MKKFLLAVLFFLFALPSFSVAQVSTVTSPGTGVGSVVKEEEPITRTLSRGTSGEDVKALQESLVDEEGIYPEALVTGYFGEATERAVKRLQKKAKISETGVVGVLTRAELSATMKRQGRIAIYARGNEATLTQIVVNYGGRIIRMNERTGVMFVKVPRASREDALKEMKAVVSKTQPPATPIVTITSPKNGSSFKIGESIPIAWSVTNTTRNSQVVFSLKAVNTTGGGIGGGSGQSTELSLGTASGSHSWATGSGSTNIPGTYDVSATVNECNPSGCSYAPSGKTLSAQSNVVRITLTAVTPVVTPVPAISSVTPSRINTGTTTAVTLHGAGFNTTLMIRLTGPGADISVDPTRVSPDGSFMTFNFPSMTTVPGTYSVQVYNTGTPTYSSINIALVSPATTTPPVTPVLDTIKPSVPTGLDLTDATATSISLTWTASTDNVGVKEYRIYRGDTRLSTNTPTATTFMDTVLSPNTSYAYAVSAVDAAGNESAKSAPITVTTRTATTATLDTTKPSVPPAGPMSSGITTTSVDLSWNYAMSRDTDGTLVSGYYLYRNNVRIATIAVSTMMSVSSLYKYTDRNLTPGTSYTYTLSAFDAAGNESAKSVAVTVKTPATADTTPPSVPDISAMNSGVWLMWDPANYITDKSASFRWFASTDNVGVEGYRVYLNSIRVVDPNGPNMGGDIYGRAWYQDGIENLIQSTTYTFTVSAYDAAGNESAKSKPYTFTTKASVSTPTNFVASKITTTGVTLSWNASTSTAPVSYVVNRSVSTPSYSTKEIKTTATTITDTGLTPSTNYYYNLRSITSQGVGSSYAGSISVRTLNTADSSAPSIPTNLKATNTTATNTTLTWTASTDNIGVTRYRIYRANAPVGTVNGDSQTYIDNLTPSTTYTYAVSAVDAAGNESTKSTTITVATPAITPTPAPTPTPALDTTKPIVSLATIPTNITTAQIVTLTATASDNIGVSKIEFYDGTVLKWIYNIAFPTGTAGYSYAWTVSSADNGTHSFTAKAYDASGNMATSTAVSVNVNISTTTTPAPVATTTPPATPTLDTTPPSVFLTASATSVTTAQTVTFTATASDNIGVASVAFTYGASSLKSIDNTSPYSLSLNFSSQHNGVYVVVAKTYDAAGNSATSNTVSVSVNIPIDTTAPTVPTNLKATSITSTSTALSWIASTDNVGVTKYHLRVYRSGSLVLAFNVDGGTTFIVRGLTPSTSYTYTISAVDASGNRSAYSNGLTIKTLAAPISSAMASGQAQSASVLGALGDTASDDTSATDTSVDAVSQAPKLAHSWTRNLQIGSPYFEDVSALQTALADQGMFAEEISGGFYRKTFAAVKAFQQKYGISQTGFVGPQTREKLNEIYR